MIYLSIVIAIAMAWMLNRSRVGLNLRSVGEDPATADAAGINVTLYKYLFTCIGGGICGLGGLYFTMVSGSGNWAADAMDGKGWLAVALVIFALWRPLRAVWGSILFGATDDHVHARHRLPHPHGDLQDFALCSDPHRPGRSEHPPAPGKSASCIPGQRLLPGRALRKTTHTTSKTQVIFDLRFFAQRKPETEVKAVDSNQPKPPTPTRELSPKGD